ncbi:sulfotransferase [Zavarzinia compransoris]|uniref:sulfotransferase family protein n=1 Tax=Zavarzinia marina TaxID=2911065 RepID=UPI001F278E4E|nr:sulfotransferase [Zavarzinia marina]MCF4167029.1 sulfotransferase [Zavarzinia marina]
MTADLICIGAQKAGTTWLHRMLLGHPAVFAPVFKEIHYFDSLHVPSEASFHARRAANAARRLEQEIRPSRLHEFGLTVVTRVLRHRTARRTVEELEFAAAMKGVTVDDDWYRGLFAGARAGQRRMDFTTSYAPLPEAGIEHILRLCPDAQVLYLLRHPVARAISHARMQVIRNGLPRTAESVGHFVDHERVRRHEDYPGIIRRWQAIWPAGRFHLLSYEDIASRPLGLLADVCGIAGIGFEPRCFKDYRDTVYQGPGIPVDDATRRKLAARYRPLILEMKRDFPQVASHWAPD